MGRQSIKGAGEWSGGGYALAYTHSTRDWKINTVNERNTPSYINPLGAPMDCNCKILSIYARDLGGSVCQLSTTGQRTNVISTLSIV